MKRVKTSKFSVTDIKILYSNFIEILKKGKNIFKILSELNKTDILSFLINEFKVIKNLPLADPSHIYTVDIHSILLIKEFEKLIDGTYKKEFPLESSIALKLKRKEIFFLTCLLHDIGKGYGNRHAERGALIAKTICDRFNCEGDLAETCLLYTTPSQRDQRGSRKQ